MQTNPNEIAVLIVDDSQILHERLSEILSGLDHVGDCFYAKNFVEAQGLLNEVHADVAILDINLPGQSGIELLRYIKQHHNRITTIMLSNQASAYYKRKCKSLGADYFVDKSIEFEQISIIIRSFS
ncbi:MAG TPA: response regulator [Puia sp.]|nr:response regulator [Puia sp.]